MQINTDNIAQQCLNAINDRIHNLKRLNIIVIGKSGVGKSTLINSLFRGNFADTGLGRPVTQEIRKIEKNGYPLAIYDTPGFELSYAQQESVKDEVIKLINNGYSSNDINEVIHCIWYCINVGSNRTFDSSEVEWLREFSEKNKQSKVPIIVVLTQSVPKKKALEMKAHVEQENLDVCKVVPILAQDMDFDEEYVAKAFGLDTLIDVMSEVLPNELQDTLQNIQKVSLESKKKHARAVIATAVAASFGEGFAPVPFADAFMLVPTQISMITGITVIFGFVSSTLGSGGATFLGKTIVSNILKFIPGVGTAVGGTISGTTAGLITTALGEAYLFLMEQIFKGEISKEALGTPAGQKQMTKLFREQLSKKR